MKRNSESKTALQIVSNSVVHEILKHIDFNCYFIRQKI